MSDAILETCVTASMIYKQQQSSFITTGCTSIDQCLKGGIIRNSITEVRTYDKCLYQDCRRSICR